MNIRNVHTCIVTFPLSQCCSCRYTWHTEIKFVIRILPNTVLGKIKYYFYPFDVKFMKWLWSDTVVEYRKIEVVEYRKIEDLACEMAERKTLRKLSNPNGVYRYKKVIMSGQSPRSSILTFCVPRFSQFMVCNYPSSYYNLVDLFCSSDFLSTSFTPISRIIITFCLSIILLKTLS